METKPDPRQAQNHKEVITAAQAAQYAQLVKDAPRIEEQLLRSLDASDKANKRAEEQIRKIEERELQIARLKTGVEALENELLEKKQDLGFAEEEVQLAMKQNKEIREALQRQMDVDFPKRPWNWKRVAWAVASGVLGVATSFILRKKMPILNTAAGACGVANLAKKSDTLKNHSMIFAAGGGLATRWGHENDNMVGMATEVALAGGAFGELYFTLGERGVELSADAIRAFKEGYGKATEKIETKKNEEAK